MSKTTTLERAYFHINNGGMTFAIVERLDTRKSPIYPKRENPGVKYLADVPPEPIGHEVLHNRSWRFKVETSHFGSGTSFSFPLVPLMVRWTIQALERVLVRMETPSDKPTDGLEYAFRDRNTCMISARDGQQIDEHWPFTPPRNCGAEEASASSSEA